MKATGIVRRIDDLGRVVIPKEIRRTMRIRDGDPLEIYTAGDGEVIFKKYSPIGELSEVATQFIEAIIRCTSFSVVICDRDHCIAAGGIPKKEVLERRVSQNLEDIMESRRNYVREAQGKDKITALEGIDRSVAAASPIISSGDISGAVVLLSNEQAENPTEADVKLTQVAAGFFGRHLEQ